MNDFVLDGEGLELAEDGGDGVTGVKLFGPGLEDYLDLTGGARNDGSKLIACVGSYVDTLEPGDHECHLGLYLKHGEATDLNVWIDFTLCKEGSRCRLEVEARAQAPPTPTISNQEGEK